MHSCAQLTAASTATSAATAAANSPPASRLPARTARAASQAAAVACSAAVSIQAQRCLTAWNWPMGRPNWWRIFAYSAAVATAQSAMPQASAASSTAASDVTAPGDSPARTRSGGTLSSSARTWPAWRVRSRLSSCVISTSAASTTTQRRSPSSPSRAAGRISTSASPAPGTGPQAPSITSVPVAPVPVARMPGANPTAPVSVPPAMSLTSPFRASAPAPSRMALASTVGRKAPGTRARPSSSTAIASSGRP